MSEPELADAGQGGTAQRERVFWPVGGGEGFRDADYGLILGKLRWPASWQMRQHGLSGCGGVAAQRCHPAREAGELLDIGQPIGAHCPTELCRSCVRQSPDSS